MDRGPGHGGGCHEALACLGAEGRAGLLRAPPQRVAFPEPHVQTRSRALPRTATST